MATEETGRDDEIRKEIESLKARLAELQDKLSEVPFTEEEYKTYRKVAASLRRRALLSQLHPDAKPEDVASPHGPRGPGGPRANYVLVPVAGIPLCAAFVPVIFGYGFEDLGQ